MIVCHEPISALPRGSEREFEQVWMSRDSHLEKVPGFVEFHPQKAPKLRTTRCTLAEFERSMIQQRVKLGHKRAVAQGKHLGRPPIASELERKAQRHLRKRTGILKVAELVGLGTGTVHRIKREMEA
jgi:hypothetical protein